MSATAPRSSSLSFRILALPVANFTCSLISDLPLTTAALGQPLVFGSSVFGPGASGHASSASGMPSPSRSGGQPLVFGSSVLTP